MAERNQADVQGQGQGGPGDEEVLMELLRRLARGRQEPKEEPQPRRMTRADRTQRINERRRAANAWGMSPAKRKYLQEQAEKRYQRREAMDAASAADREKAFKEVGERLEADRARREAFAEETYQRRRAESKAIGERKRAEAAARRERMAAAESARIAGLMEEGPRPGEMLRGGMPVSTPETRDFTDEVLRQRIQARARGSQSVPLPSGPAMGRGADSVPLPSPQMGGADSVPLAQAPVLTPEMLDPRAAEAASVRRQGEEEERERIIQGAYDQILRRRIGNRRRNFGIGITPGTGIFGRAGTDIRDKRNLVSGSRKRFRELLGDMGLELQDVPMEYGLNRQFVENLAWENLREFERGERGLDPFIFKVPGLSARQNVVEREEGPINWSVLGLSTPSGGMYGS